MASPMAIVPLEISDLRSSFVLYITHRKNASLIVSHKYVLVCFVRFYRRSLTIKFTDIPRTATTTGSYQMTTDSLAICDRCANAEEIVVGRLETLALGEAWALCGAGAR